MAFGFPASFSDKVELVVSRKAAREAVSYAFDSLGWHFENVDHYNFRAKIFASGASWGERIMVSLASPGEELVSKVVEEGKKESSVSLF